MPTIAGSASINAASTNENLLTGSQWEFMPANAMVEIGLMGDANGADLRVDIYGGMDVEMEQGQIGNSNRMPIYPDDYPVTAVLAAGDRFKIRVRNTNAGAARTVFFNIKITPM